MSVTIRTLRSWSRENGKLYQQWPIRVVGFRFCLTLVPERQMVALHWGSWSMVSRVRGLRRHEPVYK